MCQLGIFTQKATDQVLINIHTHGRDVEKCVVALIRAILSFQKYFILPKVRICDDNVFIYDSAVN